ncbi:MAG: hypothetical protein FWE22_05610 [Firmicutes bacterium]|nr:hypothetical protein [Bacillota bacterium]
MANNPNKRRWSVPSKRAKKYVEDRRAKVHTAGPKEGKELTDYEAGIRSGYLQCQSDHAAIYKYKKAMSEGKTKQEAAEIASTRKPKGA